MGSRHNGTTYQQRLIAAAISGFIEGVILGVFKWRNDSPTN